MKAHHPDALLATRPLPDWQLPTPGDHDAVFVDWWREPLGRVRLLFQLAERTEDGRRLQTSRVFRWSVNHRSALKEFLESWIGRRFRPDELYHQGVWLELWINQPATLTIQHVPWKEGRPFAFIAEIRPWDYRQGRRPLSPERVQRRSAGSRWRV